MLKSESKKIIRKTLLAVIFGTGLFFTAAMNQRSNVQAGNGSSLAPINLIPSDTRLRCNMTGTWLESKDDFRFEALYLVKDGPDYFAGRYSVPGYADADVIGKADSKAWNITMTYSDPGHRGMSKILVGYGARAVKTNELVIQGNYKTFLRSIDIKSDGTFKIIAKCK